MPELDGVGSDLARMLQVASHLDLLLGLQMVKNTGRNQKNELVELQMMSQLGYSYFD